MRSGLAAESSADSFPSAAGLRTRCCVEGSGRVLSAFPRKQGVGRSAGRMGASSSFSSCRSDERDKPVSALRLLLVEDSLAQARYIQQTLRDLSPSLPFEVAHVDCLADTLKHLAEAPVDLVLLDLVLPDSEGLSTFSAVHNARPEVPIIVLSGAGDQATAHRAVAEGAQDYLAKASMSPELLTRSIDYSLERHRNLSELRRLALMDDLTGVHNRRGLLSRGEQLLAVAQRRSSPITVLFVDVDGLKRINDTYGHHEGDAVLAEVAAIMVSAYRSSDVIGRIGGDEFCVMLLDDGRGSSGALPAAARLRSALDEAAAGRRVPLSCSVGAVTCEPSDDLTVADLLAQADEDLYRNRRLHRSAAGAPSSTTSSRPNHEVSSSP